MKPISELDEIRRQGILASSAGFPFLLVMGMAWIAGGLLSCWLPSNIAPWAYPCLACLGMPIAIALEPRFGFAPAARPDPLLPLKRQLLFVQAMAFPVIVLVWNSTPDLMPVAFATVMGAHLMPFHWVYRTPVYSALGIAVAVGPFVLTIAFREVVLLFTGFYVGVVMLIGAFLVRSHAAEVWRDMQAKQNST